MKYIVNINNKTFEGCLAASIFENKSLYWIDFKSYHYDVCDMLANKNHYRTLYDFAARLGFNCREGYFPYFYKLSQLNVFFKFLQGKIIVDKCFRLLPIL